MAKAYYRLFHWKILTVTDHAIHEDCKTFPPQTIFKYTVVYMLQYMCIYSCISDKYFCVAHKLDKRYGSANDVADTDTTNQHHHLEPGICHTCTHTFVCNSYNVNKWALLDIKAHGSESRGQEEAACMRVFWPT